MARSTVFAGVALAAILTVGGSSLAQADEGDGGWVSDRLGTHSAGAVDADSLSALSASGCGTWSEYGGGFHTSLGGNWSYLAARSGPCRAGSSGGGWGTGSRFAVEREANGEFICRSRAQGIGTNVWFKTPRGFSWSGGTSDARWQRGCN